MEESLKNTTYRKSADIVAFLYLFNFLPFLETIHVTRYPPKTVKKYSILLPVCPDKVPAPKIYKRKEYHFSTYYGISNLMWL